jgi:hypothetical protein
MNSIYILNPKLIENGYKDELASTKLPGIKKTNIEWHDLKNDSWRYEILRFLIKIWPISIIYNIQCSLTHKEHDYALCSTGWPKQCPTRTLGTRFA